LLPPADSPYPAAPSARPDSSRPRTFSLEIADRTAGSSTPSSAISLISAAMLNQPLASRAYRP
jgi:hypothetical protein